MLSDAYEPDPLLADLDVPAAPRDGDAHYWLTNLDADFIARVRSDAAVCARRTRKRQRLHFHRECEPCDDEVHQDIAPPPVRVERPTRGLDVFSIP